MQTEEERELARLKRRAREAQKQIDQIVNELTLPAFSLGYANGKMAAMLNLPYRPADIIKAEQAIAHQYWKGWRDGWRAGIEDGYKPTLKMPKPPKPTPPHEPIRRTPLPLARRSSGLAASLPQSTS